MLGLAGEYVQRTVLMKGNGQEWLEVPLETSALACWRIIDGAGIGKSIARRIA